MFFSSLHPKYIHTNINIMCHPSPKLTIAVSYVIHNWSKPCTGYSNLGARMEQALFWARSNLSPADLSLWGILFVCLYWGLCAVCTLVAAVLVCSLRKPPQNTVFLVAGSSSWSASLNAVWLAWPSKNEWHLFTSFPNFPQNSYYYSPFNWHKKSEYFAQLSVNIKIWFSLT